MSGRPTIFIIDDDESVRRALVRIMTIEGFDSKAFASAEDFIAGTLPDADGCVVADMTMPGMSGLDLKHLLNTSTCPNLPVIFLTAHDTKEMRAAAHAAGAAGYFRKPVDKQALLDAIRWALNHSQPAGPA
jgi:FixJ family two-component response regulator